MNKGRLENFSDAVFAFAGTLLILNIRIPDTKSISNPYLNELLYDALPHLVTFAYSFLVVGLFWVAHQRIFRFAKSLNGSLIWLNILYLLLIVLIPFPAAILSSNPFLPTAILFYAVSLLAISSFHFLLLGYIFRHEAVRHAGLTRPVYHSLQKIAAVGPVGYLLAALFSFVNGYVSFAFIVLVIIYYVFFVRRSE